MLMEHSRSVGSTFSFSLGSLWEMEEGEYTNRTVGHLDAVVCCSNKGDANNSVPQCTDSCSFLNLASHIYRKSLHMI